MRDLSKLTWETDPVGFLVADGKNWIECACAYGREGNWKAAATCLEAANNAEWMAHRALEHEFPAEYAAWTASQPVRHSVLQSPTQPEGQR